MECYRCHAKTDSRAAVACGLYLQGDMAGRVLVKEDYPVCSACHGAFHDWLLAVKANADAMASARRKRMGRG